ncbi:MAG: DNA polymerase III subunit delta [Candidatus Cloacimonetes bacterium]|nr:DNA polymerase III subunit delta [Candidatus Cloacimonadota bacterium]
MTLQKKRSYKHYEFLKSFKSNKPEPIYLIHGDEYYLREKVLEKIVNAFVTAGSEDFDLVTLYGDSDIENDALENLEMLPFLGKYKIVIIKDFHKLSVTDKNLLGDYSQNSSSQSILILVMEKLDKRKSAEKKLLEHGITIECKKPYSSRDLANWLKTELSAQKIRMNFDAINLFTNSLELDYMLAANELEKLIIYTKNANTITIDDIRACTGKSKANKIFDLQNSLGDKNLNKSLKIVENLLENNESGVFIIVMLTRYFTTLWKILALKNRGLGSMEISSTHLNEIFYSFRGDYIKQATNYRLGQIRQIFNLLLQADIDLKSLNIKENILLEILLYKICKIG